MGCQNTINIAELNNVLTELGITISIQREINPYELLICPNVMRVKAKLLWFRDYFVSSRRRYPFTLEEIP